MTEFARKRGKWLGNGCYVNWIGEAFQPEKVHGEWMRMMKLYNSLCLSAHEESRNITDAIWREGYGEGISTIVTRDWD